LSKHLILMRLRLPTFQFIDGETDHISISGRVTRKPTVLIRIGKQSLSRKAFFIGAALAICQILDGILTYIGLSLFGVQMEGNGLLRGLMHIYGMAPALFAVKSIALVVAIILALQAHRRKWIRPILVGVVAFYLVLAVVPWTVLISEEVSQNKQSNSAQFN
jgi:hypothetical protein